MRSRERNVPMIEMLLPHLNAAVPVLPKTNKVDYYSLHSTSSKCDLHWKHAVADVCSVAGVFTLSALTLLWCPLRPVSCRVVLHFTVLIRALHLGHVGTLPSAACVCTELCAWKRAV